MIRSIFLLCAAFTISACATTVRTPAPDLFKGASGWKTVEGTTKLLAMAVGEGDVIAEREIKMLRTGTLLEDVKSQFGVVKMKSGSPVYAVSYGQSLGTYNFSQLAWCSPAPAKSNLTTFLTGQNDVECLQYVPKGGKAKIMDGGGKSKFFSRSMSTNTSSSVVALPKIREEAVDFGRRLTLQLRVESIDGKRLNPGIYLHDGEDSVLISGLGQSKDYDDEGGYTWPVWGGKLRLMRTEVSGEDRLSVEQLSPFRDTDLSDAQMRQLLQSLVSQMNTQSKTEK